MNAAHTYRKKVEFSETDMAGMVHFSNFFRWMEAAEVEFFEKLGYPLITAHGAMTTGWPRVRAQCKYHVPVHFRDEIEVRLSVDQLKLRAIEYTFRFYRLGLDEPEKVATGAMTTVFARKNAESGTIESMAISPELNKLLEPFASQ